MGRRRATRRWLEAHRGDPWVREAQGAGYRSRAAFKLAQMDARERLLRPRMTVVDLGAAPGGWSQYCARTLSDRACIIALDCLPMQPISGVTVLQADFTEAAGLQVLESCLDGRGVDLALSDMAPKLTGVTTTDQMRMIDLAERVLAFCELHLAARGSLVVKLFQGEGFDALVEQTRCRFDKLAVRKPEASRNASREAYLVGRGWQQAWRMPQVAGTDGMIADVGAGSAPGSNR